MPFTDSCADSSAGWLYHWLQVKELSAAQTLLRNNKGASSAKGAAAAISSVASTTGYLETSLSGV